MWIKYCKEGKGNWGLDSKQCLCLNWWCVGFNFLERSMAKFNGQGCGFDVLDCLWVDIYLVIFFKRKLFTWEKLTYLNNWFYFIYLVNFCANYNTRIITLLLYNVRMQSLNAKPMSALACQVWFLVPFLWFPSSILEQNFHL